MDGFECRSPAQTDWLRNHARVAHGVGTARVLVVTTTEAPEVVAYYAWAMASVAPDDAPARFRKGAGRHPQPVALLARLGVDVAHEGKGLGAGLLSDALLRVVELGVEIGCRGLLVHAESEYARSYYLNVVPEFAPAPSDPDHLFLLMKDIRASLR